MLVKPNTDVIAKIKVIGVGGGGGNSINTMISHYQIDGVEFIAVNSDAQALKNSLAPIQLQIGQELTRGLGVGGNPEIGCQAAEESVDAIHEHLAGADMVFLTCGMGGGTGTGAISVISSIAKNLGALTVAVVTKPFVFEGKRRMDIALKGIEELKDKVDTLIVVPNQRILEIVDKNISFLEAMRRVDDVLSQGVKSISSLVTQTGLINVDFADVKSVMQDSGSALMGIGNASGENRAIQCAEEAINSPLLEMSINGATGVLVNVTGGLDLSMKEVDDAIQMITDIVDPSANIIFGATIDEDVQDQIQLTVLATGFKGDQSVIPTAKPMDTVPMINRRKPPMVQPARSMQDDASSVSGNQPTTQTSTARNEDNVAKPLKPDIPETQDEEVSEDDLEIPAFLRRMQN
ncbi:cell division protein FtsZ [Candidatus Dojkabacteria bacterium]|nr:cell division protein FtsZ [Candidatus Dojkabacteria bacterium]